MSYMVLYHDHNDLRFTTRESARWLSENLIVTLFFNVLPHNHSLAEGHCGDSFELNDGQIDCQLSRSMVIQLNQ